MCPHITPSYFSELAYLVKRFSNFSKQLHAAFVLVLAKPVVKVIVKKPEIVKPKPQIKVVMCCNVLPSVSDNDDGTWRRIRVVEFISSFVDEPNPKIKHQFKIDITLGDKIKSDGPWVEPFIFLALEYYKKYKKHGIREPAAVKKYTEEYKSESDLFTQFINEKIIVCGEENSTPLRLTEIYYCFQEWFRQTKGHSQKPPSRSELKNNLNKKFGDKADQDNKNIWCGIAFKENDLI